MQSPTGTGLVCRRSGVWWGEMGEVGENCVWKLVRGWERRKRGKGAGERRILKALHVV